MNDSGRKHMHRFHAGIKLTAYRTGCGWMRVHLFESWSPEASLVLGAFPLAGEV